MRSPLGTKVSAGWTARRRTGGGAGARTIVRVESRAAWAPPGLGLGGRTPSSHSGTTSDATAVIVIDANFGINMKLVLIPLVPADNYKRDRRCAL